MRNSGELLDVDIERIEKQPAVRQTAIADDRRTGHGRIEADAIGPQGCAN
jgi:hypothetical protein